MSTRIVVSILYAIALAMPTYVDAAKCKLTKEQRSYCKAQKPRLTKKQCRTHWCNNQKPPPVNASPVVEAGNDQSVSPSDSVTLKGLATDPDGGTLVLEWAQTVGTQVVLSNKWDSTTTFTAPSEEGRLEFRLTAKDSYGATGSDAVSISVNKDSIVIGETYFPGTIRRFAPTILLVGAGNGTVRSYEKIWNKWAEPYYKDWLDPKEKTRMGIYQPGFPLKSFYKGSSAPKDYSNPNDPAYDWKKFDAFLNMDPIKKGKAKFHWMLDVEGSTLPQWMHNRGLIHHPPGGHKLVIDFQKEELVQAMMGFWEAYAKRYDDDERIYSIFIDEDQEHGGVNRNLWLANKKRVYAYIPKVVKKHWVYLTYFNRDIIGDLVEDYEIGSGTSDLKMFRKGCGSTTNYPQPGGYDCTSGQLKSMQKHYNARPIAALSISNGYKINGGNNKGWNPPKLQNPWGVGLPTSKEKPANGNTNVTPAIYAWYISGEPRSNKDDSKLGQAGRDPAGIIPSNFFCITTSGMRHKNETPADWNRALRLFGAQGTKAVPALPADWPYR